MAGKKIRTSLAVTAADFALGVTEQKSGVVTVTAPKLRDMKKKAAGAFAAKQNRIGPAKAPKNVH
jgi:hypothetical protein